ncbi:hypothetical protein JCM11957_11660 [Caminibacter profundus]
MPIKNGKTCPIKFLIILELVLIKVIPLILLLTPTTSITFYTTNIPITNIQIY